MPPVEGANEAVETSPTQQRRTIKLVQPSPPQSSTSTVASRSVSAESQLSQPNTIKGPTNAGNEHKKEQSESTPKIDKSGKMGKTPASLVKASNVPIYEHFTPSRGPTESEHNSQSRIGSPTFSPMATFSNRASSPGGSDDGTHLPTHLRSGGGGGGKSGRVIDKLASENSRLHRELNEKTARLEEAQRTHETDTIAIQQAKESAMRHQHMYETNEAVLARRDRKVEELKEALSAEKARREHAEKERRDMAEVLRSEMSSNAQQLATEQEKRLYHQTQHEILEQAYTKSKSPWQPHVDKISADMERIAASLKQLHMAQNDLSAHQSRTDNIHQEMVTTFEDYKREKHNLLGPVAGKIDKNEQAASQLLEEMTDTLHKMKWVIAVKKNVKDT
ncbi:MAG: hypothetical protein GOMPHAMPRED_002609 [Gomphillus americanus]|uniref:SWI5-dependent HO expression protein 3 n=1 Tax=Gomphillus americanus TaxID=1940652 RepID=A0A8H3IIX5_9LECA|nr:MAG: hypothetical protein GOMPHAMPRED_002609 [Gomphillus americanus]